MTEELKRKCKICVITTLGQDEYIDCLEEQYEELEKENEQLKAQIEKMKCCANCDYWFDMDSTCELHKKEISDFMVDCSCKDWECAYKEVEMTEQVEIVVFHDKSYVRAKEYLKLKEENEQLKQKLCKKEREFKYFSNSFKLKIQKLKDEIEIMKGERE